MKKIYSLFLAFTLVILLPLQVLAAVDITLNDNSTTDIQSVSVTIDTTTDTLESVTIPIQYSEGVTVTEVNSGTIACSSLDYAEGADSISITCELDEATALEGVLANILFTSEDDTYTFTVLEDTTLDIGELEVGEIVNVGELVAEEEETLEDDDLLVTEEPALVTTQETTTAETGFSIDNLTEYLPYILIGGSVVLLVSIIGILLSKKKESTGTEQESIVEETPPTATAEPTLKDMVNKTEVASQQPQVLEQVEVTPAVTPVEPVQEAPQVTPPPVQPETVMPVEQTPIAQPNTVIPGSGDEEQDLQELMQQESPSIQPEVTPTPSVPETVMPDTQAPASVEDLQNSINNEIQNLASEAPTAPTMPPVQPVEETTSADELPPVPPMM